MLSSWTFCDVFQVSANQNTAADIFAPSLLEFQFVYQFCRKTLDHLSTINTLATCSWRCEHRVQVQKVRNHQQELPAWRHSGRGSDSHQSASSRWLDCPTSFNTSYTVKQDSSIWRVRFAVFVCPSCDLWPRLVLLQRPLRHVFPWFLSF